MSATKNSDSHRDQLHREAFTGRWDITIQTPNGEKPSWLEVHRTQDSTLTGRFVGVVGSARPIPQIELNDEFLRFSIPKQYEPGSGDLWLEGSLQGDQLTGMIGFPDGRRFSWSGIRAPELNSPKDPAFGESRSLFNGVDLAGWQVIGGENQWVVSEGVLRNTQTGGNLVTEAKFNNFQLHIEYRYPKKGNSGVYLRGRYEVQILDHPAETPSSYDLGGVYGFLAPSEIITNGPDAWNTFDITLTGRTVTIVVNGKTVISQEEIPGITGGALDSDEGSPGPLLLQGDHGPVEFREIRLRTSQITA